MPRSGTSLVHQILDSHQEVCGFGELNNLNNLVLPVLRKYEKDSKSYISENDLVSIREKSKSFL